MEREARYAVVGLFALAAIVLAFGFVWWYSDVSDRREYARYEIHFFGTVSGLAEGSPVRYLGVDVGRVERLQVDPDNPRRVKGVVQIDATAPISGATEARLGLLGLTGLRIRRHDPVGDDGDDRRADGLDDVDDGAVGGGGHGAGARDVADRGPGGGRMATRSSVDRKIGPAGGQESRREDGAQHEARADGTSLAGRDRRGRRFDRSRHVRRRGGGRFCRSGRAGRSQRGDLVVHRFLLAWQRRHVRAPHAGRLVRSSGRFLRVW